MSRKNVMHVLSLGAGLQSSTIAEMMVNGDYPIADMFIFADTDNEPPWVYGQLHHLQKRLATIGAYIDVVRIPLDDVNFETRQLDFFDACDEGYCFI